jgi:hypothetical protein
MQDRFTCATTLLAAVLSFAPAVFAQTGDQTGKPPASASAKTVSSKNLSGVWVGEKGQPPALLTTLMEQPAMTDWGKEQLKANMDGKDPHARCNAAGVPPADLTTQPIEIIQSEKRVLVLYEEFHDWRQIWTDGRALVTDADPTFNGISVGKWDGDTLAVETADFNGRTWLDNVGHPHSRALRVTERFRRVDHDTLQIAFTIDDPKAYSATWTTATRIFKLKPGYRLQENFCIPDDVIGIPAAANPPGR